MLGQYLEAEGSLVEFWTIETPRTTIIRIQAYRRRRGWLAWQTAALGRFSWKEYGDSIPPLHLMMDLPPPKPNGHSSETILQAMTAWVAATGGRQAQN